MLTTLRKKNLLIIVLFNLGNSQWVHFRHSGNLSNLDNANSNLQKALELKGGGRNKIENPNLILTLLNAI
jgi:hypothetical protein